MSTVDRRSFVEKQGQIGKSEKGMTLVELIIGLAILGLVMITFLPLSVLVHKTVLTNRARLLAAQFVDSEIERTMAATTPANYPELQAGISSSMQVIGGITFSITKDVEWVDDPSDGIYPDDPIPFDYKSIRITASAPSYFSGTVSKYADFKTFLTREGSDDPYAGIVVEVERGWTNGEGGHDPVEGATVTLDAVDGGDGATLTTNEEGRVIAPVALPDNSDQSDYSVAASKGGMMMLPVPSHHNMITASRWETKSIKIDMEEKSTLKFVLPAGQQGGEITLTGPTETKISGYEYTREITPGQTEITFADIWPVGSSYVGSYYAGSYATCLTLKAYSQDLTGGDGGWVRWRDFDPGPPPRQNLWKYNSGTGWQASQYNYSATGYFNDGENRLAPPFIDLSAFAPCPSPGFEAAFVLTPILTVTHYLNQGSTDNSYVLIYKTDSGAAPGADSGWQALLNVGEAVTSGDQVLSLDPAADMVSGFGLYFNASNYMNHYLVTEVSIDCMYTKSTHFEAPGQTLELRVAGS